MAKYYYFGARKTTEQTKKIGLPFLRKDKFLNGYRSGTINWYTNGNLIGKINIEVNISMDDQNSTIRFIYQTRKKENEEWKKMDYMFRMESIKCNFGGKKWYFICGLHKSGKYCGRRVRVLYKIEDYFGCRHCAELSYDSCNLGGIAKSFGKIVDSTELSQMRSEIKRTHYKGKLTKKYLRYLRKEDHFEKSFSKIISLL